MLTYIFIKCSAFEGLLLGYFFFFIFWVTALLKSKHPMVFSAVHIDVKEQLVKRNLARSKNMIRKQVRFSLEPGGRVFYSVSFR